ncbi:Clas39 [Clostera anastomosis granulovirus B]|uniref:Clas39 n=1 Tax=Clostera anastomosis granulovirus B TaxID=1986290 RepID=A0A0K0WSE8_9BBAC|nr:Clas39 [Clostera anastomosis granulovirus B]AKS25382.1 Clas39 [Clostera anastomosis granulovirus B]
MNRSVANWMVEKHRCTEKEKRLRNLLVINSGLKVEGGRWLDRRFDLENLDTEVLLVKVLKTLTDDRNKLMSLSETGPNAINNEDTNEFSYGKNVSSELKRLFIKKPKFTNVDSVREFILQMARTIIACNPNASILSPDFTLLATNYGLSQDTANLQAQIYELKTENEQITTLNTQLKESNDLLTSGYDSLRVAYQDQVDLIESSSVAVEDTKVLRDELQKVQNERNTLKVRINTLIATHETDMEKLRQNLQNTNTKNLQRFEEEANKQKDKIRKDLNDERDRLITQQEMKLNALREEYRNSDVEGLRKSYRDKEDKLLKNLDKLRDERIKSDEKLKNVEAQYTATITQLFNENTLLNNELMNNRTQINEQTDLRQQVDDENKVLSDNVNTLNDKLILSNITVNELNDKVNDLKNELNEAKIIENKLNGDLERCLSLNAEHTSNVQLLQTELNNLQDKYRQVYAKTPPPQQQPLICDVNTNDYNSITNVLIQIATLIGVYTNDDDDIATLSQVVLNEISTLFKIFDSVRLYKLSYAQPSLSTSKINMLQMWIQQMTKIVKEFEETEKVFEEQLVECENKLQKNKQTFLEDMQIMKNELLTNFTYETQHITENNHLYTGVFNMLSIINDLTTQTPNVLATNNVISAIDIDNALQSLNIISNYGKFLENLVNTLRKYLDDNNDDTFIILSYNARKQQKFIDDIEQLLVVNPNLDWDYENLNLLTSTDIDNTINNIENNNEIGDTTTITTTTATDTPSNVVVTETIINTPTPSSTTSLIDTTPTIANTQILTTTITTNTISTPIATTTPVTTTTPVATTSSSTNRRVPLITLSNTPTKTTTTTRRKSENVLKTRIHTQPLTESFPTSMRKIAKRLSKQYVPKEESTSVHERIDKMENFDIDRYVNVKKRKIEYDQLREKTAKATAKNVTIEGFEVGTQSEEEEMRASDLEFLNDEDVELTRDVIERKRKFKPVTSKVSAQIRQHLRKLRKSREGAIIKQKLKTKRRYRRSNVIMSSSDEENETTNEESIVNTMV